MKRMSINLLAVLLLLAIGAEGQDGTSLTNTRMDGYRGIWFELGQKYDYGDKYSGPLGTYTSFHIPLAIYSPEVNKTFFVYGGTTAEDKRHLLCMIGMYDHQRGTVSRPTVVYDKQGVNDPHDNPALLIDRDGYLWVFVSGRGRSRPGFKFKSREPFNTEAFDQATSEEMTYPQPWMMKKGFLHLFTKYTGVRQLYFETSRDGKTWTSDQLLAAIPQNEGEPSGHYQVSAVFRQKKLGTFMNRHPMGNVDQRTDLYYLQTTDFGTTWRTAQGKMVKIPLLKRENPALVAEYHSQGKNIYIRDMVFDPKGNPVCLYIRSNGHKPGPESAPYEWCITRWTGKKWLISVITTSDHNYDMGSLYLSKQNWRVVAPTYNSPQSWGVGGEVEVWSSGDKGAKWTKTGQLTKESRFNHAYVRRPLNCKAPFSFFWADGDPHNFSKSELYFGDFDAGVWKLPYTMQNNEEKPIRIW